MQKREAVLPVVDQRREPPALASSAQDVVAPDADAEVGSVLGSADELHGFAAARRFARDGGGEVDDVVVQ